MKSHEFINEVVKITESMISEQKLKENSPQSVIRSLKKNTNKIYDASHIPETNYFIAKGPQEESEVTRLFFF